MTFDKGDLVRLVCGHRGPDKNGALRAYRPLDRFTVLSQVGAEVKCRDPIGVVLLIPAEKLKLVPPAPRDPSGGEPSAVAMTRAA